MKNTLVAQQEEKERKKESNLQNKVDGQKEVK